MTLTNFTAIGNGLGGIHAEGETHLRVRNYIALENGGPAFDLKDGATVDADGVFHHAARSQKAKKAKKPRNRKGQKRRKK